MLLPANLPAPFPRLHICTTDRGSAERDGTRYNDYPLIPRSTPRFKALYRQRGAVEREFGRLKNEWGLAPLRVRRLARVRLHADLTVLARLTTALATADALPLAA